MQCGLCDVEHDGPFSSLRLDTTKMVFIPLALMLLGRSVEPYTFKRARPDVLRTEMLVRQLLACKRTDASGANDVPPLLDVNAAPFYRLGSVMSVFHGSAASSDATDKLKVELNRSYFLSVIFEPFRSFVGDRFSGSRVTTCSATWAASTW